MSPITWTVFTVAPDLTHSAAVLNGGGDGPTAFELTSWIVCGIAVASVMGTAVNMAIRARSGSFDDHNWIDDAAPIGVLLSLVGFVVLVVLGLWTL